MIASLIKAVALTAMIAVGGLGAVATTAATSSVAEAQSFEFRFGTAPRYQQSPRYARDFCDPRRAINKASRMGVRQAHVVRQAPRRIAVRGFNRGNPVRVVFANQRGCPVIAYR